VSSNKSKPASPPKGEPNPHASAKPGQKADNSTGRVQFDERGNAIWEWSISTGAFGREVSTQRLQKLEHPALSIAEDAPTPFDTVRANPLGTKKGYDPYDSGKLAKARPPRKTDLRKLGEWVKLKKQASLNKDDEE
jgi:hypothetical protein